MEEKNIVYHGSSVSGLKRLEPFKCKHDKSYVYATKDYWVMLFFAEKGQGEFDGWVDEDENGIIAFMKQDQTLLKKDIQAKVDFAINCLLKLLQKLQEILQK